MDLSLIELEEPLYNFIKDKLKLPFGVVLSYHRFTKSKGHQWEEVRNAFLQLCYDGVSFVTIHFTADLDLLPKYAKCLSLAVAVVWFYTIVE